MMASQETVTKWQSEQIKVSIIGGKIVRNTREQYPLFHIEIQDGDLNWRVDHKFRSFEVLRDCLKSTFGAKNLPPFPSVGFFVNKNDPKFIADKTKSLQVYFDNLLRVKVFRDSSHFIRFLAPTIPLRASSSDPNIHIRCSLDNLNELESIAPSHNIDIPNNKSNIRDDVKGFSLGNENFNMGGDVSPISPNDNVLIRTFSSPNYSSSYSPSRSDPSHSNSNCSSTSAPPNKLRKLSQGELEFSKHYQTLSKEIQMAVIQCLHSNTSQEIEKSTKNLKVLEAQLKQLPIDFPFVSNYPKIMFKIANLEKEVNVTLEHYETSPQAALLAEKLKKYEKLLCVFVSRVATIKSKDSSANLLSSFNCFQVKVLNLADQITNKLHPDERQKPALFERVSALLANIRNLRSDLNDKITHFDIKSHFVLSH